MAARPDLEAIRREGDLIHGLRMRPHRLIMPASQSGIREQGRHLLSDQGCAVAAASGIIVDMGMVTRNPFRVIARAAGSSICSIHHDANIAPSHQVSTCSQLYPKTMNASRNR